MFYTGKERRRVATSAIFSVILPCLSIISLGKCQNAPPQTTPCSAFTSCASCVPQTRCLWCFTTNNCTDYPVPWLLPPLSLCQLSQARWGICWMNFEALIITLGVLAAVIVIAIIVCCGCCCCYCKKQQSSPDMDEERFARKREDIKYRSDERKLKRKTCNEEVQSKYGLKGDPDHPYSKFENE